MIHQKKKLKRAQVIIRKKKYPKTQHDDQQIFADSYECRKLIVENMFKSYYRNKLHVARGDASQTLKPFTMWTLYLTIYAWHWNHNQVASNFLHFREESNFLIYIPQTSLFTLRPVLYSVFVCCKNAITLWWWDLQYFSVVLWSCQNLDYPVRGKMTLFSLFFCFQNFIYRSFPTIVKKKKSQKFIFYHF